MLMYLLYKLGIFLALHLPLKAAYKVATFIADCHFYISKKDRSAVLDNLSAIFDKSDKKTFYVARSVFRNFAKYLVDFFRFSKIDKEYIKKCLKVENIEHLDNALKKGKGAILASAHLGNWELGGAMVSKLGYPTNIIALDHKNKLVNSIFIYQRTIMGANVISIGIALRQCFVALKRNETLAILGDRDFSEHGINIKFLGKDTVIPKGPASFSLRCGSPIVPVFLLRNPDDSFSFIFEKEIEYQPTGDSEKDVVALTGRLLAILEDYIRKHPDQWYMFRRFWI